jgi:hypothetical protein
MNTLQTLVPGALGSRAGLDLVSCGTTHGQLSVRLRSLDMSFTHLCRLRDPYLLLLLSLSKLNVVLEDDSRQGTIPSARRQVSFFPLALHSGFPTAIYVSEEIVFTCEYLFRCSAARYFTLKGVARLSELFMYRTLMPVEIRA